MAPRERGLATLSMGAGSRAAHGPGLVARYRWHLETRPLLTKVLTTTGITALGSVAADVVQNPRNPAAIDFRRAARFGLVGGLLTAPICHIWYGQLGKWFGLGGLRCGLRKATLDTLVFATPWQFGFLTCVYALEAAPLVGMPAPEQPAACSPHERAAAIMPGVMRDYVRVWVPVQIVNFIFVPLPLQVLCVHHPPNRSFRGAVALGQLPDLRTSCAAPATRFLLWLLRRHIAPWLVAHCRREESLTHRCGWRFADSVTGRLSAGTFT